MLGCWSAIVIAGLLKNQKKPTARLIDEGDARSAGLAGGGSAE